MARNLDIDSSFLGDIYSGLGFHTYNINKPAETQERKPQVLNEDRWVTTIKSELPNDEVARFYYLMERRENYEKSSNRLCHENYNRL